MIEKAKKYNDNIERTERLSEKISYEQNKQQKNTNNISTKIDISKLEDIQNKNNIKEEDLENIRVVIGKIKEKEAKQQIRWLLCGYNFIV